MSTPLKLACIMALVVFLVVWTARSVRGTEDVPPRTERFTTLVTSSATTARINGVPVAELPTAGGRPVLAHRDPAELDVRHVERIEGNSAVPILVLTDGSRLEVGPWERSRLSERLLLRMDYRDGTP